jgi:type IV secretory pathway TrbD component
MAALAIGVVMAVSSPGARAGLPATYVHLLVVGWLTQLIFGVAHWLFPRASADAARGNEALGWAGILLLNVGLLVRAVAEPSALSGARHGLLVTSGALQLVAVLLLVVHIWPRVKER